MRTIYLDYNASSLVRPQVAEALTFWARECFGNPSSLHSVGRRARGMLEEVRGRILKALGDPKGCLIFTSGGTEANNLALQGIARALPDRSGQILVSAVEHSSVLRTALALSKEGFEVKTIPVDGLGRVDLEALRDALKRKTVLVSIMHANNEVGTLEPVETIGQLVHEHGAFFHTDAVQSIGKVPLDVNRMGIDLLSISAHKLGGLKGAGALYIRAGIPIKPLFYGGPHERKMRAGTESVQAILAFGTALEVSLRELAEGEVERLERLRNRLEEGLCSRLDGVERNGDVRHRLSGTSHLSFLGCDGETLMEALDLAGICASTGSACSVGAKEPSHVLVAMGLPSDRISGSIRFSLGWGTTADEIEEALDRIPRVVQQVRGATKAKMTF
jgi:cysteine desulfurase